MGRTPAVAGAYRCRGVPHDIALPVRSLAERADTVVHRTEFDRGGHFPALEAPELPAADVRTVFRSLTTPG